MYVNFYKSEESGSEWFSVTLDNDEFGQETIGNIIQRAKEKAQECIVRNDFSGGREFLEIADKFQKELELGKHAED